MKKIFVLLMVLSSMGFAKTVEKKSERKPNDVDLEMTESKEVLLISKGKKIGVEDVQIALETLKSKYKNNYTPQSAELHCTIVENKVDKCTIAATSGYIRDQF